MLPKTVDMVLKKETKNTIRYQEVEKEGELPTLNTLYIQKQVLGNNPPTKIVVSIAEYNN